MKLPYEVHYRDDNYTKADPAVATKAVVLMRDLDDEQLALRLDLPTQRRLLNDTLDMLQTAYDHGLRDKQAEIRSSILGALGVPRTTEVTVNVNSN